MAKEEFYDSETHFRQEAKSNPYSEIGIQPPEFTPVDPDISYFRESSVTMHEETVYAGETPPGETPLRDAKEEREKRRKRSQAYSWVSTLRTAMAGGAAVLLLGTAFTRLALSKDYDDVPLAENTAEVVSVYQQAAVTPQVGYSPEAFAKLWNNDDDAPHDYDYDSAAVVQEASCTEQQIVHIPCRQCDKILEVFSDPNGHTDSEPVEENRVEPTCTEAGSVGIVVYCTVCGEMLRSETEILPAKGHTEAEPVVTTTDPTCTEKGYEVTTVGCTDCDRELKKTIVIIPATGHTEGDPETTTTDPTCTKDGTEVTTVSCTVCGEEISSSTVTLPAIGHSFPLSYTETGVISCSNCGTAAVSISLNGSIVSYSINAAYASLMEGYSAVLLVDGEMLMESSGRTGSFDVSGWPAGTTLRIWVLSWAESGEYATSSRTLVTTENYG